MTVHASRLPGRFAFPGWPVALAVVLVGLAVGLSPAWRSPSGGHGVSRPFTYSLRAGNLRVTVPRGFNRYTIRGGIWKNGQPPRIGRALANFAVPQDTLFDGWDAPNGSGPPLNAVALEINLHVAMGPEPPAHLHLPLTLDQHWFQERLYNGSVGYRWGYLWFHNELYDLMYWSGPDAPANDRAAILRALKSIRPAQT